jgi:U3 small nucleolar RNA-associated protein 3
MFWQKRSAILKSRGIYVYILRMSSFPQEHTIRLYGSHIFFFLACSHTFQSFTDRGENNITQAVGATPMGLQYLITKSMLQASKALNLSLYLLLKSDQASTNKDDIDMPLIMEADYSDDTRNHPVMHRLNQLSVLTDKLQEGVEEKMPGLKDQMSCLVKAAALMAGGNLSSSDDSDISDDDDDGAHSFAAGDNSKIDVDDGAKQVASDVEANDHCEQSSSESDEEHETQEDIQRRIITEAKFALRNQDIDHDMKKITNNRKRRLAPTSSDFGDENDEITDKTLTASRKLASTMNSIVQKSASFNEKRNKSTRDDDEEEEYDRLQRGLSMMEEELGKGSDDDDDDEDDEGLHDSDEDDFYQAIKSKSKARKEAKKQIYAVAPKYPRLEGEVDGKFTIVMPSVVLFFSHLSPAPLIVR